MSSVDGRVGRPHCSWGTGWWCRECDENVGRRSLLVAGGRGGSGPCTIIVGPDRRQSSVGMESVNGDVPGVGGWRDAAASGGSCESDCCSPIRTSRNGFGCPIMFRGVGVGSGRLEVVVMPASTRILGLRAPWADWICSAVCCPGSPGSRAGICCDSEREGVALAARSGNHHRQRICKNDEPIFHVMHFCPHAFLSQAPHILATHLGRWCWS